MLKRSLSLVSLGLFLLLPRAYSQSPPDAPPPSPPIAEKTASAQSSPDTSIFTGTPSKASCGLKSTNGAANFCIKARCPQASVRMISASAGAAWRDAHRSDAVRIAGSEAHVFFAANQIEQFEKDPKRLDLTPLAEPPDSPPIGELGLGDEYTCEISGRSPKGESGRASSQNDSCPKQTRPDGGRKNRSSFASRLPCVSVQRHTQGNAASGRAKIAAVLGNQRNSVGA